jgi:hypothetical protein
MAGSEGEFHFNLVDQDGLSHPIGKPVIGTWRLFS